MPLAVKCATGYNPAPLAAFPRKTKNWAPRGPLWLTASVLGTIVFVADFVIVLLIILARRQIHASLVDHISEVLGQLSFDRLELLVAAVHDDGVHSFINYAVKPIDVVRIHGQTLIWDAEDGGRDGGGAGPRRDIEDAVCVEVLEEGDKYGNFFVFVPEQGVAFFFDSCGDLIWIRRQCRSNDFFFVLQGQSRQGSEATERRACI